MLPDDGSRFNRNFWKLENYWKGKEKSAWQWGKRWSGTLYRGRWRIWSIPNIMSQTLSSPLILSPLFWGSHFDFFNYLPIEEESSQHVWGTEDTRSRVHFPWNPFHPTTCKAHYLQSPLSMVDIPWGESFSYLTSMINSPFAVTLTLPTNIILPLTESVL